MFKLLTLIISLFFLICFSKEFVMPGMHTSSKKGYFISRIKRSLTQVFAFNVFPRILRRTTPQKSSLQIYCQVSAIGGNFIDTLITLYTDSSSKNTFENRFRAHSCKHLLILFVFYAFYANFDLYCHLCPVLICHLLTEILNK